MAEGLLRFSELLSSSSVKSVAMCQALDYKQVPFGSRVCSELRMPCLERITFHDVDARFLLSLLRVCWAPQLRVAEIHLRQKQQECFRFGAFFGPFLSRTPKLDKLAFSLNQGFVHNDLSFFWQRTAQLSFLRLDLTHCQILKCKEVCESVSTPSLTVDKLELKFSTMLLTSFLLTLVRLATSEVRLVHGGDMVLNNEDFSSLVTALPKNVRVLENH